MSKGYSLGKFLTHATILLWLMFAVQGLRGKSPVVETQEFKGGNAPLVMQGGDPYIRALMRTISMSESNYPNPYAIIHGGEYAEDLTQHPDRCTSITVGPNTGRCSTAAGRYQFLSTTWTEKARIYHPYPSRFIVWERYSFEPQYQDAVLYAWLTDPAAWGSDLRVTLQQGYVRDVLAKLSNTWTSLGYGIETNSMSAKLPELYQQFLQEELTAAANSPTNLTQRRQTNDPTL
ncbi:glycoside hydrolase family protein [filamentous cyanobacterium LEGE 11480]|uniref:Glycoside hydrolase family protein n=1 Tax=Romeriopsis navalis LEGE 11480 TaxID=2777977 RepID=A0A928Z2Q9_9CYAN|nr:glycoside hydrolase family protein [Romeriopsis navalis]MBE9028625.1 glycoside hydrolase family protein [Romeriopsis navalis LEGE 11480]